MRILYIYIYIYIYISAHTPGRSQTHRSRHRGAYGRRATAPRAAARAPRPSGTQAGRRGRRAGRRGAAGGRRLMCIRRARASDTQEHQTRKSIRPARASHMQEHQTRIETARGSEVVVKLKRAILAACTPLCRTPPAIVSENVSKCMYYACRHACM